MVLIIRFIHIHASSMDMYNSFIFNNLQYSIAQQVILIYTDFKLEFPVKNLEILIQPNSNILNFVSLFM
jgi:hypothetical protein